MRTAAIDVGSNSVLCLVAERRDGQLRRVADRASVTGLGRGSFGTGRLADAAIERTLLALREHAREARALGARSVHGVGTSALRDADDRDRFVDAAREILDSFEVISGDEEARMTFDGALAGLTLDGPGDGAGDGVPEHTVLDIGGGSTEIAIGRTSAVQRTSLQLGAVRLFERHLHGDPPSAVEIGALQDEVDRALDAHGIAALPPIVALAGTATTLACVARDIPWSEVERVHGLELDAAEIAETARMLAARPHADRSTDPRIEPARADVLVAGALLFARIAARARSARVTISDGGLRWALVARADEPTR